MDGSHRMKRLQVHLVDEGSPRRAAANKSPIPPSDVPVGGVLAPTGRLPDPGRIGDVDALAEHIDRVQHRIRPGRPSSTHTTPPCVLPTAVERASRRDLGMGAKQAKLGKRRIDQPVVGADEPPRRRNPQRLSAQATNIASMRANWRRAPTDTGIVRQAVEAGIVAILRAPRPQPERGRNRHIGSSSRS